MISYDICVKNKKNLRLGTYWIIGVEAGIEFLDSVKRETSFVVRLHKEGMRCFSEKFISILEGRRIPSEVSLYVREWPMKIMF